MLPSDDESVTSFVREQDIQEDNGVPDKGKNYSMITQYLYNLDLFIV